MAESWIVVKDEKRETAIRDDEVCWNNSKEYQSVKVSFLKLVRSSETQWEPSKAKRTQHVSTLYSRPGHCHHFQICPHFFQRWRQDLMSNRQVWTVPPVLFGLHTLLNKIKQECWMLIKMNRYVKSYANKVSCAAMLHCCFAASEMAFSESSQPPLLHCIATSLQSLIKWQSELKQYNSRCFVALLQYYIRCQSELKADPATSLLRCFVTIYASLKTRPLSLLRCFAAILYKMPVRTEGSPRYFAASLLRYNLCQPEHKTPYTNTLTQTQWETDIVSHIRTRLHSDSTVNNAIDSTLEREIEWTTKRSTRDSGSVQYIIHMINLNTAADHLLIIIS